MGAQRLMDQFHIRSKPGLGTVVELLKILPRKKELIKTQALGKIAAELIASSRAMPPVNCANKTASCC